MVFDGLDAGDETRHNGDYVGVSHDEANDGVAEGELVTVNSSGVLKAAGGDTSSVDVAGVLYTYQYYEDNETGTTVRQDRDATVKTSGTVIADLTEQENGADTVEPGATLGAHGEIMILEASDSGTNHYEVLIR
jgi:hypothetical protein